MKKILIINILLLIVSAVYSQKTGVITYERKQFWINIMSKFPFATKERIERDMMAWGKNQGKYSDKYLLYFKDNQTLYIQKENEENFGWSWKEDSYLLTRNHTDKTGKDLIGLLGKEYIIEEAMPKYKWKILNEIKEIQGYLCMKAETMDTVKNTKIIAWFTDKLPMQGGPEGLNGLPGMILSAEYNGDDVTVEATAIDLKEDLVIPYPKKMKGKLISRKEFNIKYKKFIDENIEGKRNPYWQVRY